MAQNVVAGDFGDERLKYLYLAAQLGTMRAAADALNLVPSSVSRQVAQLERDLRMPLVEKGTHKVRLTEAGKIVVEHYRESLSQKEALLARLNDLRGMRSGHYTVAVTEGFLPVLASVLGPFVQAHPRVRLNITTARTQDVITMICDDLAHVGVAIDPPPEPRVRVQLTVPQPLFAVMAPSHPFASRASLTLADLATVPLFLSNESFRVPQLLKIAEKAEGVTLEPTVTSDTLTLLTDCVRKGFGVSVMGEVPIADLLDEKKLVAVPIDSPVLATTSTEIITRLGRQLPSGALEILGMLMRILSRWAEAHPAERRTTPEAARTRRAATAGSV